jgi:FtsP/CotA-like multicopper oxidase with cupredoxin domain
MARPDGIKFTRRDMIKLGAGGAGMFALTAGGFAVPRGLAGSGSGNGGALYIEAFPTSPLITTPFADTDKNQLKIPMALRPSDPEQWDSHGGQGKVGDASGYGPQRGRQDSLGYDAKFDKGYMDRYGLQLGTHQVWPGDDVVTPKDATGTPEFQWASSDPIVYQIKLQVSTHRFTESPVLPINSFGEPVIPPTFKTAPTQLPDSVIYGFNGTFPGPRINAEYGRAAVVRFENWLDVLPPGMTVKDRQDFGAPNYSFLTHLHNGHTAPESDGQPHYSYWRFDSRGRKTHDAAWVPGEWVDQLYLGYPAGGKDNEKQSFFWFHDHVHGFTGANVYKGMVGLMPIYDPKLDPGDERYGLRLPGRRRNNTVNDVPNGTPDGTFEVDYDIPMAFYDCRLDDGVTPHKDIHDSQGLLPSGVNTPGQTHPEWWGKTFFKHFPNHGFVGDIFTVNGTAYPVLHAKRRRYRLRFLDASISRIYNFKLMTSSAGPKSARELGYTGDELQGQWRVPDAQQCMKFHQIAAEGGLLPKVITRDDFELWPAKRREFIVDFAHYMDGTETKAGDVIWLVNTMKMTTGRMWDPTDANYKIPMIKIVLQDLDPGETDYSYPPEKLGQLRPVQDQLDMLKGKDLRKVIKDATLPSFTLMRGTSSLDPETEWLINGEQFDPAKPMISVEHNSEGVWRIKNGGGGWVHPFHLHMEEHAVLSRNGVMAPDTRHPDDTAKEDVVALDPSEDVVIARRFRTFSGPYVAHCHNLAHEDHNMMFGWEIKKPA